MEQSPFAGLLHASGQLSLSLSPAAQSSSMATPMQEDMGGKQISILIVEMEGFFNSEEVWVELTSVLVDETPHLSAPR